MPRSPAVVPVCEGFLVDVGARHASRRARLALARRVVREDLPGRWRVTPLGEHSQYFEVIPFARRTIAPSAAWTAARRLRRNPNVRVAEPAFAVQGIEPHPARRRRQLRSGETPRAKSGGGEKHRPRSSDPDWSIANARIDRAWGLAPAQGKRFGEGVVVGHPDTGYTLHPEIWNNPGGRQRVRAHAGYDFVDDKRFPVDPLVDPHPSHGTKTASVIMSDAGGGPGATGWVTGAAPRATLVPFRVIESVVVFNFRNVAKAVLRATDGGCHVISMSLGGPLHSGALEDAVRYAVSRDVIVLAAAGNVWPWVVYPAKLEPVIAVAATNCDDHPWDQSAHGEAVDVSAPGESVWRAETRRAPAPYVLGRGSGTSFAVATAAGVTALWLAYHGRDRLIRHFGRGRLAGAYKELLVAHGVRRPAGWDRDAYGAGIIDAERLLKATLPAKTIVRARSKRSTARRSHTGVMRDLVDFFPGIPPARVRAVLASVLRAGDDGLDRVLADLGDELVFHVATDAGFRESLQRRAGAAQTTRRRGLGAKGARGRAQPAFQAPRHASAALRARMGS